MDGLPSHTRGINDSTPIPGQNCSTLLTLITTPSWESVNHDLRWHFLLHTYTFACLFFVLSFYTFFSFLNLRSLMSRPPFMSTINVFLCLLGASRCACLLIDPYNLKETMPLVIGSIIWDIGFPFITSAFCLIQLAFLQLTQVKFGLERFQKETYLSLMIIFHISCVIISDVTLAFHISYMSKYVVQMVFLIWAIILYVSFLYAGYKVKALLDTLPSNLLAREGSGANQKGIMQLAMLAPYNNLATSVAAALVPTLLGPAKSFKPNVDDATIKSTAKGPENNNPSFNSNQQQQQQHQRQGSGKSTSGRLKSPPAAVQSNDDEIVDLQLQKQPAISTVPEVYVRPPTPTPSIANLPIITVSSPSRRSSLASRRGSDVSQTRNSRRASECSVRFVNEDETNDQATSPGKRSPVEPNSPSLDDRQQQPPEGILRRNSECITPQGSNRDLRRGSDVGNEMKTRSQFANKLRRNSDFGNRTPRRAQPEESKLAKILDISPSGSRRNSDFGGLAASRAVESRRNSDVGRSSVERRGSDIGFMKAQPSASSRRSSDVSIRTLERSPLHYPTSPTNKTSSEGSTKLTDNEQTDDKTALVNGNSTTEEQSPGKTRKKNLSWKNDSVKEEHHEDITAETSLLPDGQQPRTAAGADFTLHSILNHIAYVNRAKSDSPLYIPEATTAAARRAQIKRVLNVTYTTAVLGILLCLLDVGRIFGPYGLLAETMRYGTKPSAWQFPKPWPWIIYQTLCRFLELVMGCAMASITKQPSASPRHQYLSGYPTYSLRMKQRDNLYI